MIKAEIVFKNGYILDVECETFHIDRNTMSDTLKAYEITGLKDTKLLYFKMDEVVCISYKDIKE